MRQETKWGATAVIAIAAAVGISSHSPSSSQGNAGTNARSAATAAKAKTAKPQVPTECQDLADLFNAFLLDSTIMGPDPCHKSESGSPGKTGSGTVATWKGQTFQPKFIIATLPDPLHTHFSLLFDRYVEAIQQGAQDEGYAFDSSWLPWETEEPSLALLRDQNEADDQKKKREDQPGVLLFHANPTGNQTNARQPYLQGLVVFVVGEDPTDGIHRNQFKNAVAWIKALQGGTSKLPVAILGPTFSGSFPSLSELLSDPGVSPGISAGWPNAALLPIYSGSVTIKDVATQFAKDRDFHSFLQDDDTNLARFCKYLGMTDDIDLKGLAILSEEDTAYGYQEASAPTGTRDDQACEGAPWLYYPRDISTLRAAYQKQSMFSSGDAQQAQSQSQRSNLPTDLADPAGEEHDTVRTYAGNQIPLSQEAELLGIVVALRSHHTEYVVLRSSNTLDPLFLANFLRREYPEARVVILNSDLLFQRGQDATALSGVMTLSTYPLIPWERAWTAPVAPLTSHRVFPENSTQGTYIASRLLLHAFPDDGSLRDSCSLEDNHPFLPAVVCHAKGASSYVPLPDYAPPFWITAAACKQGEPGESCKPATWLSVITKSGSWPLAALPANQNPPPHQDSRVQEAQADPSTEAASEDSRWPPIPLSMKLFLACLLGLSFFHAWCCLNASFTVKPAFRAHFATEGRRHRVLILMGSFVLALMAVLSGWACGMFYPTGPPLDTFAVRYVVYLVWLVSGLSVVVNAFITRKLHRDPAYPSLNIPDNALFIVEVILYALLYCLLVAVCFHMWVYPIEKALVLGNRAFAYWRSMNLASGVSPLVPFLALTSGLYLWFWYSLHGLALFGPDRPRLPLRASLVMKHKNPESGREEASHVLPMLSHEGAAKPAEDAATPLAFNYRSLADNTLYFTAGLFFIFWAIVYLLLHDVPVRSLGARTYAVIFCFWLDFCISLILAAAWQLLRTWSRLRQLLVFLDRLPLRRTLAALHGFSWGTVWKMSGNVLDVRYKLLSRQIESLNHLHASLHDLINSEPLLDPDELEGVKRSLAAVDETRETARHFAQWYADNYDTPRAVGLRSFEAFQERIAGTTGQLLADLLRPSWQKEKHSLILITSADADEKDDRKQAPPLSKQAHIRNAEELTCLTYLGFTQNILGRIRTIALGALFLFVAITLAVSNYPFDPRPALSGVVFALFAIFGAVIVYVYADMHRDATLSHITNTNPGELGSEFWFKILGFGAAPLLGLITAIFPELSSSLFSWLQPGLNSLK